MRTYRLLRVAERELQESAQFYNGERPGWGDRLLIDFGAVMERLVLYPKSGILVVRRVRVARLSDFPYNVVYKIEPGAILVIAVAHQSREFGYWRDRL